MLHIVGALFFFFVVLPMAIQVVLSLLGCVLQERLPGWWKEWLRLIVIVPLGILAFCWVLKRVIPLILGGIMWLQEHDLLVFACVTVELILACLLVRQQTSKPRGNTRNARP